MGIEKEELKEIQLVKKVAEDVKEYGGRVFYVGGYVRDKLLNKANKDIDVEVYGVPIEDLKRILSKYGQIKGVGATFGVLMVKGYDVDFTLPRTENKVGIKHTDYEITIDETLSIEEATKRRDFTINSILQDVLTLEYIDIYNGKADLKKGIIRYVNSETFKEDELRIFRACQFASRFNFSIDEKVKEVGREFNYQSLSKERVFEELNKALLKSTKPSIAFNNLLEIGVIEKLYPELYKLKGCEQGKDYHPEGDVWEHTMMVLDVLSLLKYKSKNPLGLMYSGLCHDLGKPKTQKYMAEGRISFYGHDIKGVEIAEEFMKKLTNETKLIDYVKEMTKYHMMGHKILELQDKKLRKLMVSIDINELMLFTEADDKGRGTPGNRDSIYTECDKGLVKKSERIRSLSNGEYGEIKPYFTGKDLIGMGYEQGEELGKTLSEAFTQQLSGKTKDTIERNLRQKLQPKKKILKTEDIVHREVFQLVGKDKERYDILGKRVNYLRSKYWENQEITKSKVNNVSKKGVGLNTTKRGIPYMSVYTKGQGVDKANYIITPISILRVSLDRSKVEELFNIYDTVLEDRGRKVEYFLTKLLDEEESKQLNYLRKVFGRLPNKTK